MEAAKNSVGFLDFAVPLKLLLCFLFTFLSTRFRIYSYFVYLCCTYLYFVVKTTVCRSLSNLKEKYTTTFRQTYSQLHHTVQSK